MGPVVGMSAGTADATPVWGGAYAVAYPWWGTNAHWSNLQIASAFGPSNLVNKVYAESSRGCWGCNALAVNAQVDLVSYASTPPNEYDVATVVDKGNGNDQNLAAAAMFVVTSPGRGQPVGVGLGPARQHRVAAALAHLEGHHGGGGPRDHHLTVGPGRLDPRERRHHHHHHAADEHRRGGAHDCGHPGRGASRRTGRYQRSDGHQQHPVQQLRSRTP